MDAREPARLLLVEDHPVFRMGIRQVLEADGDLRVVAEAATLGEALREARAVPFDLALVDVSLPDGNGLNLPALLREAQVNLPVLVVSMHDERAFAEQALAVGAVGYVSKAAPPDTLLGAIRVALSGQLAVSATVVDRALRGRPDGATLQLGQLSGREREVFEGLGRGQSTRAIAEQLGIGIKTVETHQIRIRRKYAIGDASELRRLAAVWVAQGRPPALMSAVAG